MQNVFIVGSKGIPGAYGGYETFVDKLTEYHAEHDGIKYHVACKGTENSETVYHNARCFTVKVPNIGPAQAIYYDVAALQQCCKYIAENKIEKPIVYILACRIGPFMKYFVNKIHKLGGVVYVNPDGHEWLRAKWSMPVRKYWKVSEQLMVKDADLLICDSKNIEAYICETYASYKPNTTFIAYGAETRKSTLRDNEPKLMDWYAAKGLAAKEYYLVVGRFVPENNYETMIREFMRSKTKKNFALITNVSDKFLEELKEKTHFDRDPRIKFVGTVYDQELLMKIRENAYGYFHGHEVGGTNPSLLEALGSTDLNLLLDVGFNREVAEDAALYWTKDSKNLARQIEKADGLSEEAIAELGQKAKDRIANAYSWEYISGRYEEVFTSEPVKKTEKKLRIVLNQHYDKLFTVLLMAIALLCYFNFSTQDILSTVYLGTLIWCIAGTFLWAKVPMFSGMGWYSIELFCFVQLGVLMQKQYYNFTTDAVLIIMTYNLLAPVVLHFLHTRTRNVKEKKQRKVLSQTYLSQSWVTLLFWGSVASMLLFFIMAGGVPMFMDDAENARITALAGRAFLVVIGSTCFTVSILATSDTQSRLIRTVIAIVMLLGTSFRSSAMSLVLLVFVTYMVGTEKKFFAAGVAIAGILFLMYALVGVFRSGTNWTWGTLYQPVLWRFFVNSSNFNNVFTLYPTDFFQYGATFFNDLAVVLPGPQDTFMTQLKEILNMHFDGGSLTPTVFGEGYYNWGVAGAMIWPLVAIVIVYFVDLFCRKYIDGRLYFAISWGVGGIAISCLVPSVLNNFAPLLAVYVVLRLLSKYMDFNLSELLKGKINFFKNK